ncbi:MAG: polysaccharide pyruvyl transferase family protein [Cyanobacteria bacterium P01_D01_bin.71]
MKVLLIGFYGYHNIGDDLFVRNLIDFLLPKCKKISVICNNNYYLTDYQETQKINFYRSQELSRIQRLRLISESDYIAWGGGTLQIDEEPKNLKNVRWASNFLGKKFGFLGVGLEGANVESLKGVKKLFSNSDFLYFRDQDSFEIGNDITSSKKSCFLGGDLAFLDLSYYEKFVHSEKEKIIQNISFTGKHWWGEGRAEFYARSLKKLIQRYDSVVHLLPGKVGTEKNDNEFSSRLKTFLPEDNCILHTWKTPQDFLKILGEMDFHIGNRLHSIILADILGVPNIGISSNPPKIASYIRKTSILVDQRISEFMEEISIDTIEFVFDNYKRADGFIVQESSSAKKILEEIFV